MEQLMSIAIGPSSQPGPAKDSATPNKNLGSCFLSVAVSAVLLSVGPPRAQASDESGYVGSSQCVQCHREIAEVQLESGHPLTLRRVRSIPRLLELVPLEFFDPHNQVNFRIERSPDPEFTLDLVAAREGEADRMHLLWGMGAGRKGITFVGMTDAGAYGQSRVSWYQSTGGLDITTGLEDSVDNAYDALADWMSPPQREHCFACHTTRNADLPPEKMDPASAGVHCERCHGPGQDHVRAMTRGDSDPSATIGNPGKMPAIEQLFFCGACHGAPPGGSDLQELARFMVDKEVSRFPAQRLVLSQCYSESRDQLKCTTCHDPHESLVQTPASYDSKCLSCHGGDHAMASGCKVAASECSSCHMPFVEGFMTHSEFADHWIRIVAEKKP
ncbi:MAG: multiheme c-type cytochrome [Acidobacteria bacterium]|nr:multiheme c-type cytochrome [Acidobacteriota bacterium]